VRGGDLKEVGHLLLEENHLVAELDSPQTNGLLDFRDGIGVVHDICGDKLFMIFAETIVGWDEWSESLPTPILIIFYWFD